MSRRAQGYIYLGKYCYAKKMKSGKYHLYEGAWSEKGEDGVAGLYVWRDDHAKIKEFDSIKAIAEFKNLRYEEEKLK